MMIYAMLLKTTHGNISMISANVTTMNEIISDITVKIQNELNKEENVSFKLRLGTLTGSRLFSGIGPNVKIKIETSGSIDTELKSEFEAQGINQTLHKIYLQIQCNVNVLTPYKTIEEKITNQVLLSEAVIIGTTPQTYFNLSH